MFFIIKIQKLTQYWHSLTNVVESSTFPKYVELSLKSEVETLLSQFETFPSFSCSFSYTVALNTSAMQHVSSRTLMYWLSADMYTREQMATFSWNSVWYMEVTRRTQSLPELIHVLQHQRALQTWAAQSIWLNFP